MVGVSEQENSIIAGGQSCVVISAVTWQSHAPDSRKLAVGRHRNAVVRYVRTVCMCVCCNHQADVVMTLFTSATKGITCSLNVAPQLGLLNPIAQPNYTNNKQLDKQNSPGKLG